MTTHKRTTKQILEDNLSRPAPPLMGKLKILLHDLRSMHNVGAVFRNADAFGISELLLSGVTPVPPRPEITKTAIGAEKYVSWQQVHDPAQHLNRLKRNGYLIAGIEQTNRSEMLPDFKPPANQPLCLVLGNEVTGLDKMLFPCIDRYLEIPQYGHKHSLNVSVAAGVVLYAMLNDYWSSSP